MARLEPFKPWESLATVWQWGDEWMTEYPLVWVVMGVSGSGKTAVGRCLAERLNCDFLEGDRRHLPRNIAKMAAGIPLEDGDRAQWLADLAADIHRAVALQRETVITCSGLKRSYRQQLVAPGRVQLVWLDVPKSELQRRLRQRSNHYMGDRLLDSQLQAIEPMAAEESVLQVTGAESVETIVTNLLQTATEMYPILDQPWWQRQQDGESG